MPNSKLNDIYSMLSDWETKAKELAHQELLSESKEKLEAKAKKLFESLAFDETGDEEATDEQIPTAGLENGSLDNTTQTDPTDLALDTLTDETGLATTLDNSDEFNWDETNDKGAPAVSVAKDGNDDTIITIDTTAADAATAANGSECTCPQHNPATNPESGESNLNQELNQGEDNEVIDMTKETDLNEILESFLALSEDENSEVETVSEESVPTETDELTEQEMTELEENLDTDSIMQALQEAFMSDTNDSGGNSGGYGDSGDDDDDIDNDDEFAAAFKTGNKFDTGIDDDMLDESEGVTDAPKNAEKLEGDKDMKKVAGTTGGVLKENETGVADTPKSFEKLEGDKPMKKFAATSGGVLKETETEEEVPLDEELDSLEEGEEDPLEEGNVIASVKSDGKGGFSAKSGPDAKGSHKPGYSIKKNDNGDSETRKLSEEELEESNTRTKGNGRNQTIKPDSFPDSKTRAGLNEMKNIVALAEKQMKTVLAENTRLKNEVKELSTLNESLETKYTAADKILKEAKTKLYEAALIANKSNAINKLFLEHITTQDEKFAIVEGFSKTTTREEVRNLYGKFEKSFKNSSNNTLNEGKNSISKINPLFITEQPSNDLLNEDTNKRNAYAERMNEMINYKGKK